MKKYLFLILSGGLFFSEIVISSEPRGLLDVESSADTDAMRLQVLKRNVLDPLFKSHSDTFKEVEQMLRGGQPLGAAAPSVPLSLTTQRIMHDVNRQWTEFKDAYEAGIHEVQKAEQLLEGLQERLAVLRMRQDWQSPELADIQQKIDKVAKFLTFHLKEAAIVSRGGRIGSPRSALQSAPDRMPSKAVIGTIIALGAGIVGYKLLTQKNKERIKEVLKKHDKKKRDLSATEMQLIVIMTRASWMPQAVAQWFVRNQVSGIEMDDISGWLWPILGELFYSKKPTKKQRKKLEDLVDEGRAQRAVIK